MNACEPTRWSFREAPRPPGHVDLVRAWTLPEIQAAIERLVGAWACRLPRDLEVPILLKPNLNNDLCALTGNSTDLRVLRSLIECLAARGHRRLLLADGSNVGVDRRGIDAFKRLRVDALAKRHGVRLLNLNEEGGPRVRLHAGGHPEVASALREAGCVISIPKVKTHAEMVFSCAMKNWVGLARGQDKRQVHYALARNIVRLNELFLPSLVLVDGLVGMEGNGPGDGRPFGLGLLMATDSASLADLVVSRLMGLSWEEIPYLVEACRAGLFHRDLPTEVEREVPVLRPILRAPPRSLLSRVASSRWGNIVKPIARVLSDRAPGMELSYRMGVIQDVYGSEDDSLRVVRREASLCGSCRRCEGFCPTGLAVEAIGEKTSFPDCIQCLYCHLVCPRDAITLEGEPGAARRQIERYRSSILEMCRNRERADSEAP